MLLKLEYWVQIKWVSGSLHFHHINLILESNSKNRTLCKMHITITYSLASLNYSQKINGRLAPKDQQKFRVVYISSRSWLLNHVTYLKLSKKEKLAKLSKSTKYQLFSLTTTTQDHFGVKIFVVLSICSAQQTIIFPQPKIIHMIQQSNTRGYVDHLCIINSLVQHNRVNAY